MRKIVVTGASSMLGVATIEAVIEKSNVEKIYAVIRPNSTNFKRLPKVGNMTIIECSTNDYDKLPALISDECDTFYHFAWDATGKYRNQNILEQSNNITNTLKALSAAHELKCEKFIAAGSQAEYGLLDLEKVSPDSPVNPVQPYGIAKYAAGKLAMKMAESYEMSCLWVRVFSVYGKYDKKTTLISSAIDGLIEGKRVSFTPAEQRWDYLHSSDAGRAFYLLGEKSSGRKFYCLGSGVARPLREYIKILGEIINPVAELGIGDIPYPQNPVMNICADISDIVNETGWSPCISFREGITLIKNKEAP